MLNIKKLFVRVLENLPTYAQTVASEAADLAGNAYSEKSIPFSYPATLSDKVYYPIVVGWDLTGTGASNVHCLGCYVSGNRLEGFEAHVKCRNGSSSSVTGLKATVYLRWVMTGGNA